MRTLTSERPTDFASVLARIKAEHPEVSWYPYSDLTTYLSQLRAIAGELFDQCSAAGKHILDVGAADGDLSFYLEAMGCSVDVIENPPTNYNSCLGIKAIKENLGSSVRIIEADVDFGYTLDRQYDLAIACGILYHLRNPMLFLVRLALHAEHMILNTRTIHYLPDGSDVSGMPVAYLLDRRESNNDPTNYWLFSPLGLERCLKRGGWNVERTLTTGDETPNPREGDQRTWVLCRRVPNHEELLAHHDF